MSEPTDSDFQKLNESYDAFISYRRKDGARHARKLRRRLLEFKVPPSVRGVAAPEKLDIYLDTIYERATENFFDSIIVPALANSRTLIIVQTPEAFKVRPNGSKSWVEREIDVYRSGSPKRPIAVALARGGFDDPLPAGLDIEFPQIERVDIRRITSLNPFSSADSVVPLI